MLFLPSLSLYIHFPWCLKKCPYCDFNSHVWKGMQNAAFSFPEKDYLYALKKDLEQALPLVWGRSISSVFIGGGTPSLLSAAGVEQLLSDIRALLPLSSYAEITLEANPGAIEIQKFAAFRASGINRLSIGIQSFDDCALKALGRIHDAQAAYQAIAAAQTVFDNYNLDLMFALPNQTLESCQRDVEIALQIAPPHLSLYQLTLEPNTWFYRHPPLLPNEDLACDMYDWIHQAMAQAGYQHYEVSAYAKNSHFFARHNLNYWTFGDYLGIGAGAHSKLSSVDTTKREVRRQVRYRHPIRYIEEAMNNNAVEQSYFVEKKDLIFEFMLNALRLSEGFTLALFHHHTGLSLMDILDPLEQAEQKGWLVRDALRVKSTPLGQRFLSDLQELFL